MKFERANAWAVVFDKEEGDFGEEGEKSIGILRNHELYFVLEQINDKYAIIYSPRLQKIGKIFESDQIVFVLCDENYFLKVYVPMRNKVCTMTPRHLREI